MAHEPINYFRQQLELHRAMRMLDTLADLIEQARTTTARARRARQTRLMLSARHTGQQLSAAERQLSTIYDEQLLDATAAFIIASRAALDAIAEQLDALDGRAPLAITVEPPRHAPEPSLMRRALDRLHTA